MTSRLFCGANVSLVLFSPVLPAAEARLEKTGSSFSAGWRRSSQ
jgi:hypothetical protein